MKFKQKLNKLKFILPATMMLTGLSLTSTINEKVEQANAQQEKVEFKQDNKRFVSYEDNDLLISINGNELTNYTWNNFNNYFVSNSFSYSNVFDSATYNDVQLNNDGNTGIYQDYFYFVLDYGNTSDRFTFNYFASDEEKLDTNRFYFNVADEDIVMQYNLDLYCVTETHYNNLKSAIELDIQANNVSMGDSITEAITSGLGLTPDLANEFLKGFTALFWDATANSGNGELTTFGTFALIFLGIAITMAVIKLVLAIIRGSTGA